MRLICAFPEILQVLSAVPCTGSAHTFRFKKVFLMFIVRHKTGSWLHIHSSEFAVYECDEHPLAKWRDTDTLFASLCLQHYECHILGSYKFVCLNEVCRLVKYIPTFFQEKKPSDDNSKPRIQRSLLTSG